MIGGLRLIIDGGFMIPAASEIRARNGSSIELGHTLRLKRQATTHGILLDREYVNLCRFAMHVAHLGIPILVVDLTRKPNVIIAPKMCKMQNK